MSATTTHNPAEPVSVIDFLRDKGVDPFTILEDGRPVWEAFESHCLAMADPAGVAPIATDRTEWHEGRDCPAQVIEWREDGV